MDLEIKDLKFSYGPKQTLKGLTFDAKKGEVLGILGENGCGKTTLLKCINSILNPDSGKVVMLDFDTSILEEKTLKKLQDGTLEVRDLTNRELARYMAVVSQSAYITFPFTVLETVMMGRYSRSRNLQYCSQEDKELIFNSLRDAGALELVHRHVNELSGGELRRVMIARALAQNPDVLLLDEPTLHLDISHQIELMELAYDLAKKRDLLVLLVTHDMTFAARYCDRIILMEAGEIVDIGKTEDVMTEENLAKIFHVECSITKDPRIRGMNVTIIGKTSPEHSVSQ